MEIKTDGKVSRKTHQVPNQQRKSLTQAHNTVVWWFYFGLDTGQDSTRTELVFFQYSNYFAIHRRVCFGFSNLQPLLYLGFNIFMHFTFNNSLLKCMTQKVGCTGMTYTCSVWFREFVTYYVFWVVEEIRFCHEKSEESKPRVGSNL